MMLEKLLGGLGNCDSKVRLKNEALILDLQFNEEEFLRQAEEALREAHEDDPEQDWDEYIRSDGRVKVDIELELTNLHDLEFEESDEDG